jgi:uncharacterized cupredoxin-like copper-binding protein
MWKLNPMRTLGVAAIVMVALSALAGVGGLGSSSVLAAGQQTEPLRIEVTLDDYSFAPEPLRIPAGRPVTLVIRNAGRVAHEFMAGREVADNDFRQDLFADLHVNIEQAEQVAAGHDEHGGHADHGDADAGDHGDHGDHGDNDDAAAHAEADEHGGGHDHDADATADAGHAHGEGHEHGTMVEAAAGETFLMTFTLPEDRRGEWATGCFLSGHYERGMHGKLIVE